jgi:hypothetical protein
MIEPLNLNYCIGETTKLLDTILKNKAFYTDILIIWEHHEIIDIIRHFDIDISRWKNKYKHEYDIVFMIDYPENKLYFDCYNFEKNEIQCKSTIHEWLSEFQSVGYYYGLKRQRQSMKNTMILPDKNTSKILVILLLFVLCLLILIPNMFHKVKQGYTKIPDSLVV